MFGCDAYMHVRKEQRNKLQPKSNICVFIGYGDYGEMGYRLRDPVGRKIIRSNDVIFHEESRQPTQKSKNRKVVFEEIIVNR